MPSLSDLELQYYSQAAGVAVTSNFNSGQQAAPAAGAAIATVTNLPAGTWDIQVVAFILGTTVAALESFNTEFRIGATPVCRLIVPVTGTAGAADDAQLNCRVNLGGPTNISVNANAAATAGSTYMATIVATKVS